MNENRNRDLPDQLTHLVEKRVTKFNAGSTYQCHESRCHSVFMAFTIFMHRRKPSNTSPLPQPRTPHKDDYQLPTNVFVYENKKR